MKERRGKKCKRRARAREREKRKGFFLLPITAKSSRKDRMKKKKSNDAHLPSVTSFSSLALFRVFFVCYMCVCVYQRTAFSGFFYSLISMEEEKNDYAQSFLT